MVWVWPCPFSPKTAAATAPNSAMSERNVTGNLDVMHAHAHHTPRSTVLEPTGVWAARLSAVIGFPAASRPLAGLLLK